MSENSVTHREHPSGPCRDFVQAMEAALSTSWSSCHKEHDGGEVLPDCLTPWQSHSQMFHGPHKVEEDRIFIVG